MADTVAIHHPQDPRRPTLIRADRYDPDRHRIWNPEGDGDLPSAADGEAQRPREEDGLPGGYWTERSGSWFSVFAPDGEMVEKAQGHEAAVAVARAHAAGEPRRG